MWGCVGLYGLGCFLAHEIVRVSWELMRLYGDYMGVWTELPDSFSKGCMMGSHTRCTHLAWEGKFRGGMTHMIR